MEVLMEKAVKEANGLMRMVVWQATYTFFA